MNEERITESPSWSDPRGQMMKTPDDVVEMLRLSGIRAGCMSVRSEPRSRSTGSPGWRVRSRPSAGCRRTCRWTIRAHWWCATTR